MAKVSAKQQAEIEKARIEEAAKSILVTTGDIQAKHEPINIVFAVGSSAGATPQVAFERARQQLQMGAVALSGNAVVYCAFAYQSYTENNLGCSSTRFTVSGYGTVVRFV